LAPGMTVADTHSQRPDLALYLDPPSTHFLNDRLFDSGATPYTGDGIHAPYLAIRDYFTERGVPVHTADLLPDRPNGQHNVYVSFGRLEDYQRLVGRSDVSISAFFAMECPVVEPTLYEALPNAQQHFKRIMSWSDGESLQHFTKQVVRCERFRWPQSFDAVHEPEWQNQDRGFLVMINANKLPRVYWHELYTARLKAVEFFHRYREIDLYGPNWDRMPNRVGKTWIPATARRLHGKLWKVKQGLWPNPIYQAAAAAHKGRTPSKSQTLSQYRFALCFENMVLNGWMTEKMFDCLFAGTVPVYWGAPDVLEWVPAECFIDMRQFSGFGELRAFLHSRTAADMERYRQAGRDYLASSRYDPFRRTTFVNLFRRFIREDVGREI
jgi:hypothetical protein